MTTKKKFTSSPSSPKPNTMVTLSKRGATDMVFVSRYRLRKCSGSWVMFTPGNDGAWRRYGGFATRQKGLDAIERHAATGSTEPPPTEDLETLRGELAALQRAHDGLAERFNVLSRTVGSIANMQGRGQ